MARSCGVTAAAHNAATALRSITAARAWASPRSRTAAASAAPRQRHRTEKEIGQQVVDAELGDLPLDLLPHPLRSAGDHRAVGDAVLEVGAARHVEARGQAGHAVQLRSQLSCARCSSIAGLAKRLASSSVSATKMWRCTPIAVPPGNSALGCAGPPRLASACLNASMLVLANGVGSEAHEMHSVLAGPGRPVVLEEPYQKAGCGCCSGRRAIGTFSYL